MSVELIIIALLCGLVVFLLYLLYLSKRLDEVEERSSQTVDRISTVEGHEMAQDSRLHRQEKLIKGLQKEVKTLEHDVGWDDSLRETQVIKPHKPE